jgi:hypothetical protein
MTISYTWIEHHRRAEDLAAMAEILWKAATSSHDPDTKEEAELLYADAALNEEGAVDALKDSGLTRTLSILAVSTIALLVKSGQDYRAIALADHYLDELGAEKLTPWAIQELRSMIEAAKIRLS